MQPTRGSPRDTTALPAACRPRGARRLRLDDRSRSTTIQLRLGRAMRRPSEGMTVGRGSERHAHASSAPASNASSRDSHAASRSSGTTSPDPRWREQGRRSRHVTTAVPVGASDEVRPRPVDSGYRENAQADGQHREARRVVALDRERGGDRYNEEGCEKEPPEPVPAVLRDHDPSAREGEQDETSSKVPEPGT